MGWRSYRACCRRNAADPDVAFCPECGNPFLRCHAFAECGGLVSPTEPCAVCVSPKLAIDAGAVVTVRKGERISIPLILSNASEAGRPLSVKHIARLDAANEVPVALTWEQLEAGAERRFSLDTPALPDGGSYTFKVVMVVASRYKGVEERYAFEAQLRTTVSGDDSSVVVQNISFEGASLGTGSLVNTTLGAKGAATSAKDALASRMPVELQHAEKYELEKGVRGYKDEALRIPRDVELTFSGFRPADAPPNGSTLGPRGRLVCGRNSRAPDPTAQATPSDLCLRAYDARTGDYDEPATLAISRHHFDLIVSNDRLCLQVRATGGLEVSGAAVPTGEVRTLRPGDRVVPIPGRPEKLALQIGFPTSGGWVERVNLTRTPATRS